MKMYKGVPIYYSLGNFLFTKNNSNDEWYTGLILEVDIEKGNLTSQLHPVRQQQKTFELSLLQKEEKEEVLNRTATYNTIITDEEKLQIEWSSYVTSKYDAYLNMWSPLSFVKNRYLGAVLRRLPFKFINKKGLALYLNLMRCEAHRNISEYIIEGRLNNKRPTRN